ncbi:MAG: hypothetical protein SGI92_04345 [Bryobacteraceae bacterium]|nr:hypothetical protein [Bryobacteraceae bacterium]
MIENVDSAVLWLNITNFAMAGAVVVCFVLLGGAILREVAGRLRMPHTSDDHAFQVPELGLTMADGGEREDKAEAKKQPRRAR